MVLRHLGCSAGTKKNKVGFIPNTTCQNKFWTELKNWQFIKKKYKIIWVKNYKSTRKIIREFLKSLRRGENLSKKNSKPISIRGKDGTIHLHTHTHTHILHGKNHQEQRWQTGRNSCNSHQRQTCTSP